MNASGLLHDRRWFAALLISIVAPTCVMATYVLTKPPDNWFVELPPESLDITNHPVKLYVIFLDDVGSSLDINLSRVVEGIQAAASVNTLNIFVGWEEEGLRSRPIYMTLNFSVNVEIVKDWDTYQNIIENGVDVIVINVHNEILPVPDGYSKEEWLTKISDFLANRWGTWAHVGGYPFKHVHYENGTTEEWNEQGFKQFMNYINSTLTINLPEPTEKYQKADTLLTGTAGQNLGISGYYQIEKFPEAYLGWPINWNSEKERDLRELTIYDTVIDYVLYIAAGVIRYQPPQSSNFGYYLHMGTWTLCDMHCRPYDNATNDYGLGYISAAAAIYEEVGWPAEAIFSMDLLRLKREIIWAINNGRTQGLDKALELYYLAKNAYLNGHYKEALSYAYQGTEAAKNATKPTFTQNLAITLATTTAITPIATTLILTRKKKSPKKEK